jgi:hypothetical protein
MPLWLSRYVHGRSLSLTKLGKHGQGASQQARSHHDVVPESARTIEDDAWSVRPTGKDPQILVFFFLLNSCIFLLNLGAVSRCRRQIGGALLPVVPAKQIGSFSCDTLRRPTTAPLYLCSTWCVDFPGIRRSAVFFMG